MKRVFYFASLMLLISACQPDAVEPNQNSSATTNYFISYNLDGTSVIEENGVDGYQISYSNQKSVDAQNNTVRVDPGSGFYNFSNDSEPNSGINFKNNNFVLSEYSADNSASIATIFSIGQHNYILENEYTEGVEIDYSENGVVWSSDLSAQPSSSNFEVTESVASTDQTGNAQQKVKGVFNCSIFNSSGASKVVANGEFYLSYTAP